MHLGILLEIQEYTSPKKYSKTRKKNALVFENNVSPYSWLREKNILSNSCIAAIHRYTLGSENTTGNTLTGTVTKKNIIRCWCQVIVFTTCQAFGLGCAFWTWCSLKITWLHLKWCWTLSIASLLKWLKNLARVL